MEINFQSALILSFRKLFQYFQKIWNVSTRLFPKIYSIFLKMLLGSQKWISKSGPKCGVNPPPTWSDKFGFLEITKNVGGVGKFWMVVAIIFYVVEFNQPGIPKKVHEQLSLAIRKPEISPFRAQKGIFITSAPNFSVADQRISESPVDSWITMY